MNVRFRKFSIVFIGSVLFSSQAISLESECEKIEVSIVIDQQGAPTIAFEINGHHNIALLDLGSSAGILINSQLR